MAENRRRQERPGRAGGGGNQPGDQVAEGDVDALDTGGDGLFRGTTWRGTVARTVPGDRVAIRLQKMPEGGIRAELAKVLHPGKGRVDPPCPAFAKGCGGCQWLHMDMGRQLAEKRLRVERLLSSLLPGGVTVENVVPMDKPMGFRNKMSLGNEHGRLVFLQEFSGRRVSPERCPVQVPALDLLWSRIRNIPVDPGVRQIHFRAADGGSIGMHVHAGAHMPGEPWLRQMRQAAGRSLAGISVLSGGHVRQLEGREWLEHRSEGIRYRFPLGGFFQTNYVQARTISRLAVDMMDPGPADRVLDLYCGCGFFSLPLASRSAHVHGLEEQESSIRWARENAGLNGRENLAFTSGRLGEGTVLPEGHWDLALLDPPRAGCEPGVLQALAGAGLRRIVYISCDPVSLARDLGILGGLGWKAVRVVPVDLFPHSSHVETIACLEPGD